MTSIEEEKEAAVKRAEDAERRAADMEKRLQKALKIINRLQKVETEPKENRIAIRNLAEQFISSTRTNSGVNETDDLMPTSTSNSALEEVPEEFECSLCLNLLLDPVSVTCGHTFCQGCINWSLQYRTACPLCRKSIPVGGSVNIVLANIIAKFFPQALTLRKQAGVGELIKLADAKVYKLIIFEATENYNAIEYDDTGMYIEGGYAELKIGNKVSLLVDVAMNLPTIYEGNQYSQHPTYVFGTKPALWIPLDILRRID